MALRSKKQDDGTLFADEDDLMGDEYEEEENVQRQPQDISTGISADGKYLTPKSFGGCQTIRLQIDSMASLEELASGAAQTVWKPLDHLLKEFKHNTATKNRDKATGEQLAGNVRRMLPLGLRIVQHGNGHAVPIELDIPGLVPRTIHRTGRAHWRVAANTPVQMVDEPAFEPSNPMTRYAYNTMKVCSLESLKEDIHHKGKTAKSPQGYSTIATNSLPYEVLCDNLFGLNGATPRWAEFHDQMNLDEIEEAVENHRNLVEVPTPIAKEIEGVLRKQAEEMEASLINLEDFAVTIRRSDGNNKFNSYQGLKGELVGSDIDPQQKLRSAKLQRREQFFTEAELAFILF